MTIAVPMKLVDLRPDIDPVTGAVRESQRRESRALGASSADYAALEVALRVGEVWGREVVAVSAGPIEAEGILREARTMGASRAIRVELPTAGPHGNVSSSTVAAALAGVLRTEGPAPAELVVCGAASLDRGSGAVPAFLAEELDAAQALGLMSVDVKGADELAAIRRLDGGRRERLRVTTPAVVSVEAGVRAETGREPITPRRASLEALLDADTMRVETALAPAPRDGSSGFPQRFGPFRPRPRALPGPDPTMSARERAVALTSALGERTPPRTVTAGPEEAAEELLAYLRERGYLPGAT